VQRVGPVRLPPNAGSRAASAIASSDDRLGQPVGHRWSEPDRHRQIREKWEPPLC
jgi:hypothetical protein